MLKLLTYSLLNLDAAVETDAQIGIMHYDAEKPMQVGGQAVIEGVMMRSPNRISTAVRKLDGSIKVMNELFVSFAEKYPVFKLPVLRGSAGLIEMLYIGITSMNWSASEAMEDLGEETKKSTKFTTTLAMISSIAIGIVFFFVTPLALTTWATGNLGWGQSDGGVILFNVTSGAIRVTLFLGYLALISRLPDVRRLFQYHGSEHKSIYAFEEGKPLTVASAKGFTTLHPRCGTSFLLIVMLVSVLTFSLLDTIMISLFGHVNLAMRMISHLPFIPIIGGLSYEVIKISARNSKSFIGKIFTTPGLWLQRVTTQEPDERQLEVALASLKASLGIEGR
jgi:uncharacterized protein YqhQ